MKLVTDLWRLDELQSRRREGLHTDQRIAAELTRRSADGWRLVTAYVTGDYAVAPTHWFYFEKVIES